MTVSWLLLRKPIRRFRISKKASSKDQTILSRQQAPAIINLVYMLTIPSELCEVQEELGLRSQGSFMVSVKNPERPGPASARLPQKTRVC